MANSGSYELQSLPSHEQSLSLARSKDYEGVPNTPSKDQLFEPSRRASQSPPPVLEPRSSYRFSDAFMIIRTLLLPLVAIAYLAFCYTVHARTVPLKTTLFDTSLGNLAVIKSGVTSISIIIITLGLFPIQVLISDLRSEEFFRVISRKSSGAPLHAVNNISGPSFAVAAALLAFVTSTLAPAALSVNTALFDDDLMAFAIGAIYHDDVLNTTVLVPGALLTTKVQDLLAKASTLSWVENQLGVGYSFQVSNGPNYIVPVPQDLAADVPARWLSDVAILNPQCEWADAHREFFGIDPIINATVLVAIFADHQLNLTFNVQSALFQDLKLDIAPFGSMSNTSDHGLLASGAMAWTVANCFENCNGGLSDDALLDLSGIPTLDVTRPNFNRSLPDLRYHVGFLICEPHADFETREVRNDGHGRLTVQDVSYPFRQGNLHPTQTNILFTNALSGLAESAGPTVAHTSALGSEGQASLIFGPNATNITRDFSDPATVIKPAPIENITASYTLMLRSATKVFLSGAISKAYVPGRLSTQQVVFTSSLPQVIVSTILFFLLCVIATLSHFRKTIPKFTLFSVAASLDGSDIPNVMSQVRNDAGTETREADMVSTLGKRAVVADEGESGPVLHLT